MPNQLCIKRFPVVLLITLLCGCSLPMMAIDQKRNEVFRGTLSHNVLTGRAYVEIQAEGSKTRCAGTARVNYSLQTGSAAGVGGSVLNCDDGRVINGSLSISGSASGSGSGTDQYGNKYQFTLGAEQNVPEQPVPSHERKVVVIR